jgi:hypothetical protein
LRYSDPQAQPAVVHVRPWSVLQVGDPLLEIAILLDLWAAGRRGDGHGDFIRMTLQ